MIANLQFRVADAADLPEIADLRWRLQTDDVEAYDSDQKARFINDFIKLSSSDNPAETIHWVGERDGETISVMSVRIVKKLPKPGKLDGRWGYLTNAYTLQTFRGKGAGAGLLEAIKLWASKERLELLVVWPSDRAYSLYERAGFARPSDPLVLDLDKS